MRRLAAAVALLAGLSSFAWAANRNVIVTFDDGSTAAERAASVADLEGTIIESYDSINSALVSFPGKNLETLRFEIEQLKKSRNTMRVENVEYDEVRNWLLGETALPDMPSYSSVLKDIKASEPVKTALTLSVEPKVDNEIPWGVKRVNAAGAWAKYTGEGVKVAVVDTGVDLTHPDLAPNIKGNFNAIDPDKPAMDDQGHGTHVAGTIAAIADGKGVVGIAPKASLYAVKVLGANGSGSVSAILKGIDWAVKNKMNVINMSLGAPSPMYSLDTAVRSAHKAGVTVICAAGNDSGPVNYPAAYPGAFAVSALDERDGIASFSSRGPQIVFIAPGVNILSTYKGGKYAKNSGTSMASPHVAGLAVLAFSAGATTPDEAIAKLKEAAATLPNLVVNDQGSGLIDAGNIK